MGQYWEVYDEASWSYSYVDATNGTGDISPWSKLWDETHSAFYFFNSVTEDTRWDQPDDLDIVSAATGDIEAQHQNSNSANTESGTFQDMTSTDENTVKSQVREQPEYSHAPLDESSEDEAESDETEDSDD